MTTGNGLFLSGQDFLTTEITVQEYIKQLSDYLDRMVSFGAYDTETANAWADYALRILGYSGREEYEAKFASDTRIINPSEGQLIFRAGEIPSEFTRDWKFPWEKIPTYTMAMPEGFSAGQLPLFKQVVAPIVYRNEAQRQATKFGYIDEKGEVVDESAYNTLLRNAIKNAESYQLSYVNEWLVYNKGQAEISKDNVKIKRANENLQKVQDFMIAEMGRQQVAEREAFKKQEREVAIETAWEEQRQFAFPREPAPLAPPTGEVAIREFLEEDRPGGLQRFIEAELPGVLDKFQREQAGAMQAWQKALSRPAERLTYEEKLREAEFERDRWLAVRTKGIEAGLVGKLDKLRVDKIIAAAGVDPTLADIRAAGATTELTQKDMMPSEWAFLMAQRKSQEFGREATALQGFSPERIARFDTRRDIDVEDPLKKYLAQYPWTAEFMKLSPGERGFQPRRFAPSARWFV